MQTLLAWTWLPLAVVLVWLGLGLLAGSIARYRCAAALTTAVGMAVSVGLVELGYRLGLTGSVLLPLLGVLALAGLVVGRRELIRFRPGPAGAAAAAGYLLYLAPVLFSGHWSWAGYNFTNDPSLLFTGAEWIAGHGYQAPGVLDSTSRIIAGSVIDQGYPLGAHLVLATIAPVAGLHIEQGIQPFIALMAALAASAACHILRRTGVAPWIAALAAAAVVGAGLLYAYSQLGGLKELATVATLMTAAALGQDALRERLPVGAVALIGVTLASLGGIFSLGGFGYAGLFAIALALLALVLRMPIRRLLVPAAVGVVVFLVAAAPVLADSLSFGKTAADQFGGGFTTGVYGQLLRALPLSQIGGVWLGDDWRAPVVPGFRADATGVLNVLVLVLALVGVLWSARRRQPWLAVIAAVVVFAAVVAPRTTPYGDSKLLIVLAPFVLLSASAGLWALSRVGVRPLTWAAAAVAVAVLAGIFYSDAIIYRQARLAPADRMEAIEDVAHAARGKGLTLFNEWEEYAKYFTRSAQVNVPGEIVGPKPFVLRQPGPTFDRHFDLDELDLRYVLGLPAIVTLPGPATSRPPADYRSVYRNRYYELWVRDPHTQVDAHLPLQGPSSASRQPLCWELRGFVRDRKPGEALVAHRFPAEPSMNPVAARDRSGGWATLDLTTVLPTTPGDASQRVRVARAGRYTAWVRGTSGRPVDALVDGRRIGSLLQVNAPAQWVDVGTVDLSAGSHVLQLRRPGGSLRPGDSYREELGPLTLTPVDGAAGETIRFGPGDVDRLCHEQLDWVERVRER